MVRKKDMKKENKTILLQSMYVILGLMCFIVVLETGSTWISMYPEAASLIRIGIFIGIVAGILISVVSTQFGKLGGMIYEKNIASKGVNTENENDMDI